MARLTFWFDLASSYSWLSTMRLPALAEAAGVAVAWQPFLLGPIFRAQGWETSPFNLYPAKGAYMWIDLARQAAKHGLPAPVRPDPFPQSSLLAARVALALGDGARAGFCRAVFAAEFQQGRDISAPETLAPLIAAAGGEPAAVLARAGDPALKAALREATERAAALGIFGAPSFIAADGALYWGDDRLEDALAHAAAPGGTG